MPAVGEHNLGDLARAQIAAARRDPRLDRSDGRGMMVDFRDAMEEAERVRRLGYMGLHELSRALEREEEKLGVRHDDEDLPPSAVGALQAAWERTELAKAELANDTPHANAQALISMCSALDAMVEDLAKLWREFQISQLTQKYLDDVAAAHPELKGKVPREGAAAVEATVTDELNKLVPKALTPKGVGAQRYEKPLHRIGWGAPKDRPIPGDMDSALAEAGALRDVLVHRAGRVDQRARDQAPELRYAIGEFVRLTRDDYRRYSAAIRCYGLEIGFRAMRSWPEVTDETHGPRLEQWRHYVAVNA